MNPVRTFVTTSLYLARRHRTRLVLLVITLLLASLAALNVHAQEPARPISAASLMQEAPEGPILVRGGETPDPIVNAVEEYRRTGNARTIQQSTYVVYPYGHSQPTLTCAPLRACVIELEEGEILMNVISGDTERWIISEAFTGRSGTTPLVVVKPTSSDLTTNLLLSTDRRIYELTLDAPPSSEESFTKNPQARYTRHIKFYYPDDMVKTLRRREGEAMRANQALLPMGEDFRLENLNFNYKVMRGKGFPFVPEQVFDDGAHTYVKLPAAAKNDVAPVLFIYEGGERQVLNYAVRSAGPEHQYYITDRVVGHGVFVIGVRKKNWRGKTKHSEERLTILNLDRE